MAHRDTGHGRCVELFEKLSDYLDQDLSDAERSAVERHIRGCCHCQVCYETLRRTVDLCRHAREEPVSPDFSTRLRRLVEELAKA